MLIILLCRVDLQFSPVIVFTFDLYSLLLFEKKNQYWNDDDKQTAEIQTNLNFARTRCRSENALPTLLQNLKQIKVSMILEQKKLLENKTSKQEFCWTVRTRALFFLQK